MSAIVELCNLEEIKNYKNFELSKKNNPVETYLLTKENVHRLQEKNEHNCILSMPGKDILRRKILRLSYNIPKTESKLDFSRNYIKSIPNKLLPNNLEELNISHNIIDKIDDFTNIDKLKYFNCSHNNIQNMPELPNTLEEFYINDNNIDKLPESIIQCTNLKNLNYENNRNIKVSENVLDFVQEIFERIREEEERIRQEQERVREERERLIQERLIQENRNRINNNIFNNNHNNLNNNHNNLNNNHKTVKKTVNEDSQNVHDVKIRDEVANAIKILIKDKCKMTEEEALTDFGKVIGYEDEGTSNEDEDIYTYYDCFGRCKNKKNKKKLNKVGSKSEKWTSNISDNPEEDYKFIETLCSRKSICSKSKVTFGKLFRYFWNRVRNSEDRDEILKIFIKSNLPEMRIVCFVGRISRVINCLNGFFQDISVGISIEQQIQMKYNLVYRKYNNLINTPLKYNILCYYHFKELLEEIKMDDKKMNDWLYPFMEEINDNQGEENFSTNQLPKEVREKYVNDLSNDVFGI